jgi:hypothetical protein
MQIHLILPLAFVFCLPALGRADPPAPLTSLPFTYVGGHMLRISGRAGDAPADFILDTGIGVNALQSQMIFANP